ncbi:hypothetical protein BGZ63DRAFT_418379 [Mariannaea sp. PMI_226]|nr:hypothetical protein BGZ63DRAFT_418379 [Mariannaea sp. PMI_226]
MDAIAPITPAAPRAPVNPLMTPAKQERILIWRTEVASALSLPTSSHSSDTSNSAASPLPEDGVDGRPNLLETDSPLSPTLSKGRGLWKRISWRFSRRRYTPSLGPDAQRTSMYRNDRPKALTREGTNTNDGLNNEGDAGIVNRYSEEDGGANGLRQRQERLQRAARLLTQGTNPDDNRDGQTSPAL